MHRNPPVLIETSLHQISLIWTGVLAYLVFNARQPRGSFRIGIVVPIYVVEPIGKYTTFLAVDEEINPIGLR